MKKVTLFFQTNVDGLSLASSIVRLSSRLNFELVNMEGKDCSDFRIACTKSHAVIIDLSIEADGKNNFNLLVDEHSNLDHVLIVSRTYLPMNVRPVRKGGTPPYPFPQEEISGFRWSNTEILNWLKIQLTTLLATESKHLVSLERENPDFPRAILESLIRMSKDNSLRRRAEIGQQTTIFISYRGQYYEAVSILAKRIRKGEWHPGKNPNVVVLTPGQLAFERELLSELRRWQVLGMLEELIGNSTELWIYETEDYLDSWWTIGELVCAYYKQYMWKTDQNWVPGPEIRIYDPGQDVLKDKILSKYKIKFSELNRAQLDRMMSIASLEEIDLPKVKRTRVLAKIYTLFYFLGLGRLFTKPFKNLAKIQNQRTRSLMPQEDQAGMARMQEKYLAYWAKPKKLLFQMQSPLLQKNAWNLYSTSYNEQFLDSATGRIDLDKFFNCIDRLNSALSIERLRTASSKKSKFAGHSDTVIKIKERPPRWLWQGADDSEAEIYRVPTYTAE